MSTPEGKVKNAVRKVLKKHAAVYAHWPVPYGYGRSTLDAVLCINGLFVAIETKAPGEKPTARQQQIIGEIERAGGVVFVIDGDTSSLEKFLDTHNAPSSSQPKASDRRSAALDSGSEPIS